MKMYFWKQAWLKAPLLLCLAAGQVQAATITADGNCTLADAITAANTDTATGNCISGDAGKDTIELTYSPLLPEEQLSLPTEAIIITPPITPINEKMLPQITTEIAINGNDNTLNGNNNLAVGSLLHVASSGILTLNEITITGGTGYIGEDGHRHGGGIYSNGGSLTLNNSTVSGNLAAGNGGGIYSNGGFLTMTNSTVSENSNSAYPYGTGINYGGGIFIDDSIVTLINSTVNRNEAWSSGGGIYSNGSTLTLTNSTVSGNSTFYDNGGGIYANSSTLSLTDSTVSENKGFFGGGIYAEFLNDTGDTITLTNSTVSRNESWLGGGIFVFDSNLKLINSTASGNLASDHGGWIYSYGGGICVFASTAMLTNSTISGNEAAHDGGGIYSDGGFLMLTNSTVSKNEAGDHGGGIYNNIGHIALTGSIISGNTANNGNEISDLNGDITGYNYNLFGHSNETNTQAFFNFTPSTKDVTATSDGTTPTAPDAILLPLADNGGPTQTHALVTDSPAVDLDTACSGNLTEDQRGEPRPDTGCDAGAFEGSISLSNSTAFLPTLYLLLLNN
ncbi:MAG: choice-of-anchor Q domain-containing protein [Candidatus Electrothrix communis]|nr:MAG: choice-of-anchor Q domain-containing protein [Candidatus Electrothrix communis]